jgi:hypothetical protein
MLHWKLDDGQSSKTDLTNTKICSFFIFMILDGRRLDNVKFLCMTVLFIVDLFCF